MFFWISWSWASKPLRQPWFSLYMALVGLGLLGAGGYVAVDHIDFARTAVHVPGTVIGYQRESGAFRVVVSFKDGAGKEHHFVAGVATNPPAYNRGDEVTVLLPGKHPEKARLDAFFENWFASLLLGGLGSLFSLGAALTWIFRRQLFAQYG